MGTAAASSRRRRLDGRGPRSSLLRPWTGRRLPRDLHARSVGQLAAYLEAGLRDPGFPALLARIDTGPIHEGNRVEIFADGELAYGSMLEAIRSARAEILLESYILKDDSTGQRFLHGLEQAVARGVVVRVLADAFGSFETGSEFWSAMRAKGIQLRLFHRLFPKLWNQAFRDHRKIVVVDRRVAFTGGMNIADEYGSSHASPQGPWRDTHARLEGPAASEMAVVFAEGWSIAGGHAFTVATQPVAPAPGARALVLDSFPGRGHQETAAVLAAIVGAARRRVWITNAYFAPGHLAVRLLKAAARRGVDVRLLLPGRSDVPLARHAGHGYFANLLKGAVRVFEYQAAVLHAKSLVVDDYACVVGSTNLDFRSFRFNAECNLVVLDAEVGGRLASVFEEDMKHSREISLDAWAGRSWLHRIGDAAARLLSPVL